jgi:hypothetical protein
MAVFPDWQGVADASMAVQRYTAAGEGPVDGGCIKADHALELLVRTLRRQHTPKLLFVEQ